MSKDWRKDFKIVWHGEVPDGVEAAVRADLPESLWGLGKPSDLGFHTVFLDDDDMDGPSVSVWGQKRDRRFHAEYSHETEWVTLNEVSDD